jgi:orotate phosphoribosyltransferase
MDKRQHLRDGLLNIARKWGQGVGRDGKGYGWMIDCRELLLQGDYLEVACQLLWDKLKHYQPSSVGGLTLAANPLTIGLMHTARRDGNLIKGLLIRRSPKEDGLQRQVEGPQIEPGEAVVLVDDLVNSGDTQRVAEVSGKLSWLDSDGQLLGAWKVPTPFLGRPVCVGNEVYLAGGDLSLVRLTP